MASSLSRLEELQQQPGFRDRLEKLSDLELLALSYDWQLAARPKQLAPVGDWSTWLILAGRGFGKTRVGAEMVRQWVKDGHRAPNIIAATADDLRDVCVEGESGVLAVCPPHERPQYLVSKRRLEWPNGARTLLFTAEEPDRLRGKQHTALWADELASWKYEDAWDQAMFGLRLGKRPQSIVTTTPRPTALIRRIMADPNTVLTRGTTYENRSNLARDFYAKIIRKYEGTRLGRQELDGEVLDDNPGALWKLSDIDATRIARRRLEYRRIVVALDPAVTSEADSDEWGIVVAGIPADEPEHFDVLEDASAILSPDQASKRAVQLYWQWSADRVIGEGNNGGDMIEALLRHQDANVSYRKVTATRGKAVRAEPISALYEQHRAHHVGTLAKLEDELITWDPATAKRSPNRLDALVWALTELSGERGEGFAGYYEKKAVKYEKRREESKVATSARLARQWSLSIRQLMIEEVPAVTKDDWATLEGELGDWIKFCESNGWKDRLKFARKMQEKLEKKFGKTHDAE